MTREILPNRRPNRTIRVTWGNMRPFHVTVGLDPVTGKAIEVFYSDGMRTGTDLLHTVQDGCVLVSQLMQHGVPLDEIGKSLSASGIIGALVAAVVADVAMGAP